MAKKYRFFAWATGKSAKQGASDLRKLICLIAILICIAGGAIVIRQIFWADAHDSDHPHEIGPHGGIIVAANEGEPHYHVEFVVESNGRTTLFTYGSDTKHPLEVFAEVFVAQIRTPSDGSFTTVVFRPQEGVDNMRDRTSRFIGRIPPSFVGDDLRITIPTFSIGEKKVAIAFDFDKKKWAKESSGTAQAFERQVLLKAKGDGYTEFDIEANGRITASDKYGPVQVTHKMKPDQNTVACPVTTEAVSANSGGCCVTGDCCCPLAGLCCDPFAASSATISTVAVNSGEGCCATGNCCCPFQGLCCDPNAQAK